MPNLNRDESEDTPYNAEDCLGVDLGLVNIATTSDGQHFSGDKADNTRKRYTTLKAALQSKGTKSAKRYLKKDEWKRATVQNEP
jgi:putative transposase